MQSTDQKLNKLDSSVKKTDKSFGNFTKSAKTAGLAALAVGAAIGVAVKGASEFAKELEIASNRTGDSVERLQELAYASNTVGISLEKLGDIGKDTNEKIAEFLATGGGGFQDFIDVMDLTAQQASDLSHEFSNMSGTEVLQAMVSKMEQAGVSTSKMSFALEGMASDTTDLIPLLRNGGEATNKLATEFSDLGVTLSKIDVKKITEVGREFDNFTASFGAQSTKLVADYSEEIIKALSVISFLGEKTIDTFNVITSGWGSLISVSQAALTDFVNGTNTLDEVMTEAVANNREALNDLLGDDYYALGKSAGENMGQGMADGLKDSQNKVLEITVKGGKSISSWEKLDSKQRLGVYQDFIGAASKLSDQYLEDNKGVRSALVVMDTAAGVARAFSDSPFWVAVGQSAVIVANGVAQLSNIQSASKGGGSISGGVGGGGASSQQPDFQQDSTGLDFTDSDASGSTTNTITFSTDTGDELVDAIANALNKGQKEGRF